MTALAFVAALLLQAPQDPVHVSASLGASQISVGATTTLRIEVEARGTTSPDISSPALPAGLEMVGSSDFSQLRLSAPGQSRRSSRRELVIRGTVPGVYTIPAVQVVVGTRSYRTEPLELTVTGTTGLQPGAGGDDAFADPAGTTLRLSVSPDTVYVGQQVVLTAEATFAEAARLRQTRPASFEPPATSGFWVQDLPDPITVSLRVADGRSVETQTYRRAYFPLRAGEMWFPPAHLHYELRRGFLQAPENRRIASDSLSIIVLPVPTEGQPDSFTGAVGRYELRASVAPARVAVGDAVVLTVELTGQGNIRALPEPRLSVPEGLELLPPAQESSVHVTDDLVAGSKEFRWVLVPEQSRSYVIPPIEYSYFDPELRTFVTLQSDPLALQAVPVVAPEPEDTLLRPLRARPGSAPAAWALSPWFAAAQAVPVLLVGLVGAVLRRRQRPPGPGQHARRLRRDLDALRSEPGHQALAGMERLLKEAVRLVAELDDTEPVAALRAAGRHDAASALDGLLFELRRARYAPGSAGSEAALIQTLADRVDRFIAGLYRQRARTNRVRVMVVLAAVGAGMAGAATVAARDAASVQFQEAGALHAAGDAAAAANAFHAYARLRPHDPAGWYNLGVAAFAAGDPGRAVWAWLRAARLAPRDEDTRHNLHLAGASGAVGDVVPVDRLAAGERAALAALAWWLLVFAAGHAVFRRQPRVWAVAAVAAIGLVVLAGTAVHDARRPIPVVPMGQGASVYAGSSIHDDRLAELRPGMTARLVERRDGWLLVRLPDGGRGWVERSRVAAP